MKHLLYIDRIYRYICSIYTVYRYIGSYTRYDNKAAIILLNGNGVITSL